MFNNFKKMSSNSRLPGLKSRKSERFGNTKLAMIDEKVEEKINSDNLKHIEENISSDAEDNEDMPIEKMLQQKVNKKNIKDLPSKPNLESKLQKPDTSNFNCDSIIE